MKCYESEWNGHKLNIFAVLQVIMIWITFEVFEQVFNLCVCTGL